MKHFCSVLALLALGCGGSDNESDDYQYDRADVEAALFGTWQGAWVPSSGSDTNLTLEVRSPGQPALGSTCGTRTLGGLGLTCVSSSTAAVAATLTLEDGSLGPLELDGSIDVDSLNLDFARLSLADSASTLSLSGDWSHTEGWTFCRADDANGVLATCTLTAREP